MVPGRISNLPLELRLIIYDNCDKYPDDSHGGPYSDPWSDLPRGHDIGARIDGAAITNLIIAFPELKHDLSEAFSESQGRKTLVFEDEDERGDEKDTASALDCLGSLLDLPPMDTPLRIALDIRGWNDNQLTGLFVTLIRTKQIVHANLVCTSAPGDLVLIAAKSLKSRCGSLRVYEECNYRGLCYGYGQERRCSLRDQKALLLRPSFWFVFHEELHGFMHELD